MPTTRTTTATTRATTTPAVDGNDLRDRYQRVRGFTEELAEPLSPEDQTVQTMPDVSPTKWHRAHTTWFFETFVLGPHDPTYTSFHPRYEYLFNSYYEAVGPRHPRPQRGLLSRPNAADVARYRVYVGSCGPSTNVSKNHVVCARCHFVGLTSGIDWMVWSSGESGLASSSVRLRTAAYGSLAASVGSDAGGASVCTADHPRPMRAAIQSWLRGGAFQHCRFLGACAAHCRAAR